MHFKGPIELQTYNVYTEVRESLQKTTSPYHIGMCLYKCIRLSKHCLKLVKEGKGKAIANNNFEESKSILSAVIQLLMVES